MGSRAGLQTARRFGSFQPRTQDARHMPRVYTGLRDWFRILISGKPHFYIGGQERPYMLRWYIIPRNRWLNVYLHKICRDDDDRALHDHPWWFVSIMLRGAYIEHTPTATNHRRAPSIAFRSSTAQHRLELYRRDGETLPCWTLVITGRRVRNWGFWCPKGFVPWQEFVASDDPGSVGKGCGEA